MQIDEKRLEDYRPPAYRVEEIALDFDLGDRTRVRARTRYERDPAAPPDAALILDGRGIEPLSLSLDGRELGPGDYALDGEQLVIPSAPARFELEALTELEPGANKALEGLYRSGGMFCTQCEAEGFRRITFYPDRPDVLAPFDVTLRADAARCPVLLSNGNPAGRGELDAGRHWARFRDPFPKPCYLFALVAGDLHREMQVFTTRSGRRVEVSVWVREPHLDRCRHALESVLMAMRWDEERYGREYDLDVFHVVAVDDFNMGAMENKGLNIFNAKYVLARPETATDQDLEAIRAVVAHEYFHNWTGNRVTLRDWFQLSLKEGLTVFRDQQYTADQTSAAVKRIQDAELLRDSQFAEDAGPLAHPVRPRSYRAIDNFYTRTVYEKGAELIRMLHTLLGPTGFRRGCDLYFERCDGKAATCEDFVQAMEAVSGRDLGPFMRWYAQAGTPVLRVTSRFDAATGTAELELSQSCPPTPGQAHKEPFHIPLKVGLLDEQGRPLALRLEGEPGPGADERLLEIRAERELFRFAGLPSAPHWSLLRGFSAPVRLEIERSDAELAFLLEHETDAFNRFDAGQQLALRVLGRLIDGARAGRALALEPLLAEALAFVLAKASELDPRLAAQLLSLPGEQRLIDELAPADPGAVHAARVFARRELAARLRDALLACRAACRIQGPYAQDPVQVGKRSLARTCLGYLAELEEPEILAGCLLQLEQADNLTDSLAALGALAQHDCPERQTALAVFEARWKDEPVVLDKWFAVQATSRLPGTLERVKELLSHPGFDLANPNRVRAVIGAFCAGNPARFHDPTGAGYAFCAEQVLAIDAFNPQVAARLAQALSGHARIEPQRSEKMRAALERIASAGGLSRNLAEVVERSLGGL
ncbi:MAG: aminopeptidase N [Deltaproteobacteria bacterium]|nr:aminopeptidase N [Deltaproteobacteria bacterium]